MDIKIPLTPKIDGTSYWSVQPITLATAVAFVIIRFMFTPALPSFLSDSLSVKLL